MSRIITTGSYPLIPLIFPSGKKSLFRIYPQDCCWKVIFHHKKRRLLLLAVFGTSLRDYRPFIYQEEGTVKGYVVYKYYQPFNRIHILDMEAENETIFQELLKAAGTIKQSVSLINVLGSTIYADYFFSMQVFFKKPGIQQPHCIHPTDKRSGFFWKYLQSGHGR